MRRLLDVPGVLWVLVYVLLHFGGAILGIRGGK
jgi:hypothetical protein